MSRIAFDLKCGLATLILASVCLCVGGCVWEGNEIDLSNQDVRLTVLHTSDWHGRLLAYDMDVLRTDRELGLEPTAGPFGGIARLSYLINRERANAGRSIYVDSGDCFQGAPIFNAFEGEAEFRAMSLLRPDATVLGNHEFDNGLDNLVHQARNFANFPLVAANYHYLAPPDPNDISLADVTQPYTVVNVDGLIIGIIGVANFSSLSSIGFADNSVNIVPMDIVQSVQTYINLLHPQVNLIFAVSHAGLDEDHEIIEQTVGLDAIFGGHLHIVLDPPRLIRDASGREVLLAHSGAFLKYLGRLDMIVRSSPEDPHDFEVISHQYEIIPIDSRVPEDTTMLRLIEPYARQLRQLIDVSRVIGYAPRRIRRFGSGGGDSELGDFVSDAIRTRRRVETDFAINNSLGIRSDVVQGPIYIDQMFNIFPFPNSITTLTLSGNEVQELLNYNAERSAGRGCATQLQSSGITFTNDCSVNPAVATDVQINDQPIQPNHFYTMATNNYLAGGGSGFRVLRFNNTQQDTGIAIRDAVIDEIASQPSCLSLCEDGGDDADSCSLLFNCRTDMADYYQRFCAGLEQFSSQAVCLDENAPQCLELSDASDFDICRQFIDPACDQLHHSEDREVCYEAAESQCQGEDTESPRHACAEMNASQCVGLDPVTEYDVCAHQAVLDAEEICLTIPCLDVRADGRIQRILPSNEYVPTGEFDFEDDASSLMESIQASEHNHEDCY